MSSDPQKPPYALYQPNGSKKWSVRFSVTGQGQQRIALGTHDRDEAERLALAKYHETVGIAAAGLSVTRKSFAAIAEEFIEELAFAVERGEKEPYHLRQFPPIIRRYFVGYFGDALKKKSMSAITGDDIEAYWRWRYDYWTKGPGRNQPFIRYEREVMKDAGPSKISIRRPVKETAPSRSTLSKEKMLLKQLWEYAQERKYVLEIPPIKLPKSKKRAVTDKPGFTLKEFLHLQDVSVKRIAEAEEQQPFGRLHIDRVKLHAFIMIAGFTGMRSTELNNLRWGDIGERTVEHDRDLKYAATVIQVRGKGKEREMVPLPEVMTHLNMLRNLFQLEFKREPDDADPVFFSHDGAPIKSFKKGLAALLDAAGLRTTPDGRMRDSHSFRPFYISQQIREGVNPHMLIRNTGTSGKMVNAHYNKILPTEEIGKLTPDWLKSRPFTSRS
jgi:integrase